MHINSINCNYMDEFFQPFFYLRIADDPEVDFSRSYEFICDRLRGVRQDLMVQDIHDETKIQILEYCTTFHLYASYE